MTNSTPKHNLRAVASQFQVKGDFVEAAPYGTGHINDTYCLITDDAGQRLRYIFQRLNHLIFKDLPALQENIERVTSHIRNKLMESGVADLARRVLTLIPTTDGKSWCRDADGNTWRAYLFIEKAQTYDVIESTEQAEEAAKAFGLFQKLLTDLPGPRLHETIPEFHHTRSRFNRLQAAIQADAHNRAADVKPEIAFALARENIVDRLLDLQASGAIPEHITHNDTKLNNVMLDNQTSQGICVLDLDTVMPGLVLYDFGDMVRSATRSSLEDEQDLSKVYVLMDMYEALVRGYIGSAADMLNQAELDNLAFSAQLITFEIGIRFLTDYLEGDVYFKTHRDKHNIDRTCVQFKMVECFEEQAALMNAVVQNTVPTLPPNNAKFAGRSREGRL